MKAKRTIYISNLFRFRYWMFVLGGSLIAAIPLVWIPVLGEILWLAVLALLVYYWLTVQMACRNCGRMLATQHVSGLPESCSHCNYPTDKGLRGVS